jgi:hypothetical protein
MIGGWSPRRHFSKRSAFVLGDAGRQKPLEGSAQWANIYRPLSIAATIEA